MDTKWKKLKIALKFMTFFLGMSLFISNLLPIVCLLTAFGGNVLKSEMDYQESEEFRWRISERLEELLCVATGGKGWKNYEGEHTIIYSSDSPWTNTTTATAVEDRFYGSYAVEGSGDSTYAGYMGAASYWDDGYEDWYEEPTVDTYMADMAQDKALLYAVVFREKLLYTNIDAFEDKIGEQWDGADFQKSLSPDEYNFILWFNRQGDGKVQISKDGKAEDIYGNGVYTKDSRWFVPGYTNFTVDASTNDAVIFMAVEKDPKLYVSGVYSEYGTTWYSGRFYYMQQNMLALKKQFQTNRTCLLISVLILALSFIWRKEKRLGDQAIAFFLQKIWLEIKIMFLLIMPVFLFFHITNGAFAAVCFWTLYLAALDLHKNRGRQKKPLVDNLRTKDLTLPIQKRLVKRYRLTVLTVFLMLLLCFLTTAILFNAIDYYSGYVWETFLYAVSAAVIFIIMVILIICVTLIFIFMKKNRQLAEDIGALADQISSVREGNLTDPLKLPKDADLRQTAQNLNEIQHGLETALRQQMRSEQMKVELVTNVSHDIKTPLTSIISYVELLRQEEGLPTHVTEFIQILSEKAERLKNIVQDVFEISKAASGQLPVKMEELDLGKLLRQTLADMNTQIEHSGLTMKIAIPEAPMMIRADGQRLYRIFQNLIQNALKYSLQGSRIFLTLMDRDDICAACIKNTSSTELCDTTDFTERFVRGDASRTDGGSGLGLSIAKSFTEACGGGFHVEVDADLFTVTVTFPKLKTECHIAKEAPL